MLSLAPVRNSSKQEWPPNCCSNKLQIIFYIFFLWCTGHQEPQEQTFPNVYSSLTEVYLLPCLVMCCGHSSLISFQVQVLYYVMLSFFLFFFTKQKRKPFSFSCGRDFIDNRNLHFVFIQIEICSSLICTLTLQNTVLFLQPSRTCVNFAAVTAGLTNVDMLWQCYALLWVWHQKETLGINFWVY